MDKLTALLDALPEDLGRQVFTHASWSSRRSDSYARLAFLGDSVLELAISAHMYPRLEAEAHGAGQLTKIRAQTVSGASCRAVAERLGVPERLQAGAPEGMEIDLGSERVLASITEAIIGACFLHVGYDTTAEAVVEAFTPELREALEHPVDFKSALQERLAQHGEVVEYSLVAESGPPHDRTFEMKATAGGRISAQGTGRSKKQAEQDAARRLLEDPAL
ncbi:MAG TPA: ribonuclease III domain-containing protein [Baekduia sp.]|nr:ribonuclease III domain-containing protein [Baekduia sp.]